MLSCSAWLSSTTSRRLRRGAAKALMRDSALLRPSAVVGLPTNEKAPRARPCWRSSSSVTICTGMCRVAGSRFRWLKHRPAQHVRQEHVERDGGRPVLADEVERVRAGAGHQHLEAVGARQVDDDARIARIVLDDQHHRVVGLQVGAVVGNADDGGLRPAHGDERRTRRARRVGARRDLRVASSRERSSEPDVAQRQVQRERAAGAGRALQRDLAAQQAGELAADREAQPGAAVLAAGARVRLLERLEDELLLLRRNADARIA